MSLGCGFVVNEVDELWRPKGQGLNPSREKNILGDFLPYV